MLKVKDILHISDNARHAEIQAYVYLRNVIFGNSKTFVGDDIKHNRPDIYTLDNKIGVEVTLCETVYTFQSIKKSLNYPLLLPVKSKYKTTVLKRNIEHLKEFDTKEYYYESLKERFTDKILTLSGGQYSACQDNYLIILSTYKKKEYFDISVVKEVYEEARESCRAKCEEIDREFQDYKNIYVVHDFKLYELSSMEMIFDYKLQKNKGMEKSSGEIQTNDIYNSEEAEGLIDS